MKTEMDKSEFEDWMKKTGYSNINDWNMQEHSNGKLYYFIKNYATGRYALIKELFPLEIYSVLVEDWVDYNGWID